MATSRLYYNDSFEREFEAEVRRCEPVRVSAGLKAPAWSAMLDRTLFYPTSGGQPHDLGRLGEASVLDVLNEGDEVIHVLDRPLELGPVRGCIDWDRRFDHMQQHTGQHLLSAIFQERFGLPTVSFHLGSETSSIDLRGLEPSEEIREGAERATNEVIFENRPVTVRYGTAEQLSQIGVRKEVDRRGILRAIEIEGADLQPCGGTHVKRTGQIGLLLVRRCTKIRQDWRVEFVCGRRAERAARADFQRLRQVAAKLDCALEAVAEAAERAVTERDENFKKTRAISGRLAEAEAALVLLTQLQGPGGVRVVVRSVDDVGAEYLGQFAARLTKEEKTVVVLISKEEGHIIFAQHSSVGKDMNALLKQVLEKTGGKGGGTRDFARGRLTDAAQAEKALSTARELLQSQGLEV
ncbi:MAG: alanyl-tRNA editing protein [Candidatus Acidiferrales bacterium]